MLHSGLCDLDRKPGRGDTVNEHIDGGSRQSIHVCVEETMLPDLRDARTEQRAPHVAQRPRSYLTEDAVADGRACIHQTQAILSVTDSAVAAVSRT